MEYCQVQFRGESVAKDFQSSSSVAARTTFPIGLEDGRGSLRAVFFEARHVAAVPLALQTTRITWCLASVCSLHYCHYCISRAIDVLGLLEINMRGTERVNLSARARAFNLLGPGNPHGIVMLIAGPCAPLTRR